MNNIKMLYFERIDVSEGIDVNASNASNAANASKEFLSLLVFLKL